MLPKWPTTSHCTLEMKHAISIGENKDGPNTILGMTHACIRQPISTEALGRINVMCTENSRKTALSHE